MSVTEKRIATAATLLANADVAARACRTAGLPYWAACALLEQESGGRNVYGHDTNGVFSRDEFDVVGPRDFMDFLVRVLNGALSNGVGPCQITYAGSVKDGHRDGGYFRQMAEQRLLAWEPEDNMVFGFRLLVAHHEAKGSWRAAGAAYNGQEPYGVALVAKMNAWRERLSIKGGPVS